MVIERDVRLTDGRLVRSYDTGAESHDTLTLLWHHGSRQTGAPIEPLLAAAAARHIRLLSYARPSYGGSTPNPGRNVASAAADVAQVADALGLARFAVMGASGGGPHALACAALMPDRISGVVCLAGLAPFTDNFDWYGGMISSGGLHAAASGREARRAHAAIARFDENSFTAADRAALGAEWAALGADSVKAGAAGPDGLIDDDVAYVTPWGFDPGPIKAPILLVQGGEDRIVPPAHADWLLRNCSSSELWLRPRDGHISVLDAVPVAMDWLRARTS
jgi:pimeloyl-ACP methyl ester carboxylesterase